MQPPRRCHDIQTDSVRHPDIHTGTHPSHKTCRNMCDAPLIWSCTFRQVYCSSYLVLDILGFVPGIVVVWGTDRNRNTVLRTSTIFRMAGSLQALAMLKLRTWLLQCTYKARGYNSFILACTPTLSEDIHCAPT